MLQAERRLGPRQRPRAAGGCTWSALEWAGAWTLGPGAAGQGRGFALPGGLVVRIRRSHRRGPGSIPGQGNLSSSPLPTDLASPAREGTRPRGDPHHPIPSFSAGRCSPASPSPRALGDPNRVPRHPARPPSPSPSRARSSRPRPFWPGSPTRGLWRLPLLLLLLLGCSPPSRSRWVGPQPEWPAGAASPPPRRRHMHTNPRPDTACVGTLQRPWTAAAGTHPRADEPPPPSFLSPSWGRGRRGNPLQVGPRAGSSCAPLPRSSWQRVLLPCPGPGPRLAASLVGR